MRASIVSLVLAFLSLGVMVYATRLATVLDTPQYNIFTVFGFIAFVGFGIASIVCSSKGD